MQQINQILKKFNIPIKEILIEKGLVDRASDLLSGIGFKNKKAFLVTDQNLVKIAQNIVDKINCQSLVLDHPKANIIDANQITKVVQGYDFIIGVGSGVINDLCKVVSSNLKIPYVIFGTAPSMNGYASANASITIDEYKTSIPAQLPSAIYLDLEVLRNAPERLVRSGIGDSLCFSTCHFDWLLSHLLLGTYYDETPFNILENDINKLLVTARPIQNPQSDSAKFISSQILNEKEDLIKTLAKTLIISGLGMYICKGSYPASQAEHLIAHYIEILYPKIAINSYHGEQIAVTTLSVCDIQEKILRQENLQIKTDIFDKNYLIKTFGKDLAEHFYGEIKKKEIDQENAAKINLNLKNNWQDFKEKLKKTFVSKEDLLKSYRKFSLPENCVDIGWSEEIYEKAINNAHLIRNRFTSLDLNKIIL